MSTLTERLENLDLYIHTELPERAVTIKGYSGDPRGKTEDIIRLAPIGTFYLQSDADNLRWERYGNDSNNWRVIPNELQATNSQIIYYPTTIAIPAGTEISINTARNIQTENYLFIYQGQVMTPGSGNDYIKTGPQTIAAFFNISPNKNIIHLFL